MEDRFTNDVDSAAQFDRDHFPDDDDRAYNASVEMEPEGLAPGWYPGWKGPDTGAFEDWMDHLRANGETHTEDEDIPLPDDNDFPF